MIHLFSMKGCVSNGTLTNGALAKQTHKRTQLENLDLLANPFGQVLSALALTYAHFEIKFALKSTQVFSIIWPSNPSQRNKLSDDL